MDEPSNGNLGYQRLRDERQRSSLAGVDLRGADLSCVDGITAERLRGAIIDETTLMPPGLEHLVRDVPPFHAVR